ncbi:MAG: hypothetical protein HC817_01955 [Saprospiraceae bacterium]|nr:hypothetical protein [Saprospiraceae bacterium]
MAENGWLAAVPPCVGFAGWLFGGMDSKPLLNKAYRQPSVKDIILVYLDLLSLLTL